MSAERWWDCSPSFICAGRMEHGAIDRGTGGKFRVFDFSWNFYSTYTFWSGVIGGAFLTTATHGTDQLIVQRLLAARNERQSKLALISSGIAVLVQFWLFLLVGAMLFVFYNLFPPVVPFTRSDTIFPDVYRDQDAARSQRAADLRHSCGRHVEPECGSELAVVDDGGGFLPALAAAGERRTPSASFAPGDRWVGDCLVRAGDSGAPWRQSAGGWACPSHRWPMDRCWECFCWAC